MDSLEIRYTPKEGIVFQKFQNNQEIEISSDSVLTFYMNQGSGFVMQEQGEKFMKSLAEAFNGYEHVQIEAVMPENDFRYLKELYTEYADKTQFEMPVRKIYTQTVSNSQEILEEIKKHMSEVIPELKKQHQKTYQLLIRYKALTPEMNTIHQQELSAISQFETNDFAEDDISYLIHFTDLISSIKNLEFGAKIIFSINEQIEKMHKKRRQPLEKEL